MMRVFRDLSIRRKLMAITLVTSCVVLSLASAAFVVSEVGTSRRAIIQELSTIAEIVASNSAAAVIFDDQRSAEETLMALKAAKNIVSAQLYTNKGDLFAHYVSPDHTDSLVTSQYASRHPDYSEARSAIRGKKDYTTYVLDRYVDLYRQVLLDDEVIGELYIRSNLDRMYSQLNGYFILTGTVILYSLLVAFLLSSRLQRLISEPILHLANVMKAVSSEENYSIRARKGANDELGTLIDGFNTMLSQIQARDEGLRAARHQAEMANRAKTEFLANMSHELRTPLNAILGFSEVMANELLGPMGDPQYQGYARDIHESGTHLLQVINDILDIAKVEAGKLELSEEEITVSDVVEKSLRLIKERAENAGLDVTAEIDPDLPSLYADKRLVKQCLINLLSNAVKFTPKGGRVSVRGFRERDGRLAISVADNGIGIAKQDIPRVLAPFGQVDGSLSRKYDGTGLGLPLVKSLVQLHGGSVDIQSEIAIGTTVTVRFPVERICPSSRSAGRPPTRRRQQAVKNEN